uniref:Reverse transcriptase domain-containing protein n=1 Tax=Leptobrachium leishanense TaxID=445787 RepID=A0A8C5MZK2_9ANUR
MAGVPPTPSCFVPRDLILLSYNVKGLNAPEKRSRLLRDLFQARASVAMLQETHFRGGAAPVLRDRRFPVGFFGNYSGGKSRGVAILFAGDVPFVFQDSCSDDQGRYLFVKGTIADITYTFATIYVANTAQSSCLARIMAKLRRFQDGILVVASDMNTALQPSLDTSCGKSALTPNTLRTIRRTLHDLRLVDTWRALHPAMVNEISRFTLDHTEPLQGWNIFLEQFHLDLVVEACIHPTTWSDHAPISVRMKSPLFRPRERSWRLNTSLLSDPVVTSGTSELLTKYFEENTPEEVSWPVIWEAHKAVVRGELISRGTALKKNRDEQRMTLLEEIRSLELRRGGDSDAETQQRLLVARHSLNDLLSFQLKQTAARTKCFFALHENRPGKLLARILRKKRLMAYIPKIKTVGDAITLRPEEISAAFRAYYASLYHLVDTPPTMSSLDEVREYIETNLHTRLQDSEVSLLDEPISKKELLQALKSTKNGKSPGPDGLPAEYYKEFQDLLLPPLLATLNALNKDTPFHPHTLCATITVLPKPGKDPAVCESYRPISLLNSDVKLLARVLADRLKLCLPHLIHPDQVGFIPGREARDGTQRVLNAVVAARNSGQRLLLLSTDAEKAFDRVSWPFLFQTLRSLGIGPGFLAWTQALYTSPTARVKVNGALSDSFQIFNGTRQGCPLSPLLFALSLEPFLEAVRRDPAIPGIKGVCHTHKVSAYADDMLFFLTDAPNSLPAVVAAFKQYGRLAGMKINMTKSEILNISLPAGKAAGLAAAFPFHWCKTKMKYLGIWISPSLQDLYALNFQPLLGRSAGTWQNGTPNSFPGWAEWPSLK